MRSAFALVAFSAVALAQSTVTPVAVDNPATQYLTETNSLGVVTGQPDAVTSQPAAVTSQPGAASIPAGLTTPVVVPTPTTTSIGETTGPVSSGTTQTGFTTTASASASGSDTASESGSSASGTGTGTASGSAASSTGTGAAAPGATAGPVGLSLVAGAAIAMLL